MSAFLQWMTVLAAEAGGEASANGGDQPQFTEALLGMAPIIAIIAVFFWIMHRSQKKREKQREEMLDSIEVKDDVMTIGGIRGRVVRIDGDEVVLRIDPEKDIKIRIAKSGISSKVGAEESE